jgi:hypothetical protein
LRGDLAHVHVGEIHGLFARPPFFSAGVCCWPLGLATAAGRGDRLRGCCAQITIFSRISQFVNLEIVRRLTLWERVPPSNGKPACFSATRPIADGCGGLTPASSWPRPNPFEAPPRGGRKSRCSLFRQPRSRHQHCVPPWARPDRSPQCRGSTRRDSVVQQSAAAMAIPAAPADRIGRRHDVAVVIINQAVEKSAGFDPRLAPCRAIVREGLILRDKQALVGSVSINMAFYLHDNRVDKLAFPGHSWFLPRTAIQFRPWTLVVS